MNPAGNPYQLEYKNKIKEEEKMNNIIELEKEIPTLIEQMKKGTTKVKKWLALDYVYIDEEALLVSDAYYMFVLFHSLNIKEPLSILKDEEVEDFDPKKIEYSELFDSYCLKDIYEKDVQVIKKAYNKFRDIKNYKKLSDRGNRLSFEDALKRIQSEFPCNFSCDVLQRAKEVTEGVDFDEFSYVDNSTPVVIRHKPFGCDIHQWESLLILHPQTYSDF